MAYESVILFISFGWFISVSVIFLMYVRMKQLSEELKILKYTIEISDDEMSGLERGIADFKKSNI
ncbi:hypothetical protein [Methanocella arvoryzae]|uniref:hypothetical protein n=1 Tax=Methanocella arvoryzae TaxID=1175445 RepID=UPI000326B598|nr:hypothetical protein [Methanocella arvoryzae]